MKKLKFTVIVIPFIISAVLISGCAQNQNSISDIGISSVAEEKTPEELEQEKKYQATIMETGEKALSNHLFLRWIYPEGLTEMSGSLFFIQGSIFPGMVHAPSHIEYKKKYCKV